MKWPRFLLVFLIVIFCGPAAAAEPVMDWGDARWRLQLDPATGVLVRIENKDDPQHMNWLREPGHWERRTWTPDTAPEAAAQGGPWGLIETASTGPLTSARVQKISDNVWESVYVAATLIVTVRRELDAAGLKESYTFRNTGPLALEFPLGSVSITAPLFDQYPDAVRSLNARCDVHLWMGGTSAWINAECMSGAPPHLGLVITQGSLDAYSQRGGTLSDRGTFVLHPGAMNIPPGQSRTIAWRLFWHDGWDAFFAELGRQPGFIRLTAPRYTVVAGEPLEVAAESPDSLASARVLANGQPVAAKLEGHRLTATIPTTQPGEIVVEVIDNQRRTWLRANATPPIDELIAARVKFIVEHQQRRAEGDRLDGAYLIFDNETGQQVYEARPSDHNAGRERLGMGVLGALYLPLCRDEKFKAELAESLARYAAFVRRELEDDNGVVYGSVGRADPQRMYNFPWVAQFNLAMYRATGAKTYLDRFVQNVRAYYARGGARFYAIGLPVTDGLKALAEAGREEERAELLASFRAHADNLLRNGTNYPASEVNFEQSIVAPAVQFLLEVYLATGEPAYLDGARKQMPVLEAFNGRQPDHRLYEVALRHWDDYWFGKIHLYGDTLPHYWSTLSGLAFAYYGRAIKDATWFARAQNAVNDNLSLFTPDGRGTAAHLYPLTSNGRPAAVDDPWANDQDWALVNLLLVREVEKP